MTQTWELHERLPSFLTRKLIHFVLGGSQICEKQTLTVPGSPSTTLVSLSPFCALSGFLVAGRQSSGLSLPSSFMLQPHCRAQASLLPFEASSRVACTCRLDMCRVSIGRLASMSTLSTCSFAFGHSNFIERVNQICSPLSPAPGIDGLENYSEHVKFGVERGPDEDLTTNLQNLDQNFGSHVRLSRQRHILSFLLNLAVAGRPHLVCQDAKGSTGMPSADGEDWCGKADSYCDSGGPQCIYPAAESQAEAEEECSSRPQKSRSSPQNGIGQNNVALQ